MAGTATISEAWDRYKQGFLIWLGVGIVQGALETGISMAYPQPKLGKDPSNWLQEMNIPLTVSQWALAAIVSFLVAGGMVRMALWQMRHGEVKPGLLIVPGRTALNLVLMALTATATNFALWAIAWTQFGVLGSGVSALVLLFGTVPFILAIPFAVDSGANAFDAPTKSAATIFPRYFSTLGTMLLVWLTFVGIGCVVMCPLGFIAGMSDVHLAGSIIGFVLQALTAGNANAALLPNCHSAVCRVHGRQNPQTATARRHVPRDPAQVSHRNIIRSWGLGRQDDHPDDCHAQTSPRHAP